MKVRFYCDGIGDLFHGPDFIDEWIKEGYQFEREPIEITHLPAPRDLVSIGLRHFTVDARAFNINPWNTDADYTVDIQLAYEWSHTGMPLSVDQWVEELTAEGWKIKQAM